MRHFFAFLLLVVVAQNSLAQTFLSDITKFKELEKFKAEDSFCTQKVGASAVAATSYQSDKLVPLASVSKLLTSFWALSTLGPFYRFETHFFVNVIDAKTIDLHIAGSRDPYNTYEKLFYIVSELNRTGITQIRHLTFDENFTVYLGHRDPNSNNPSSLNAWTENQELVNGLLNPEKTRLNLYLVFDSKKWTASAKRRYEYTLDLAKAAGIAMTATPKIAVGDVALVNAEDFRPEQKVKRMVLRSAPLYRYLKDMNNFSNNYVADQIFLRLGGRTKAAEFYSKKLKLTSKDLQMHTGSGLPLREPSRVDNLGTCAAVLRTVNAMTNLLSATAMPDDEFEILKRKNLSILDVMLVVGVDEFEKINGFEANTTYQGNELQDGAVVAKTGLINSAINVAGAVFTNEGVILYGVFLRTAASTSLHNPKGNRQARDFRRDLISDIIRDHGGARKVSMNQHANFFPADKKSALRVLTEDGKSLTLN